MPTQAAKQACLRAKLGTNSLDPRCEALVAGRAAALKACRPVAAAGGCAQGPVPIACMQRRYRKAGADTLWRARRAPWPSTASRATRPRKPEASNRAADERQARIAAILKAMPPAEAGGIRGEHARLVAAAHLADQEARATTDYLAKRYPSSTLPDGTHVKATRVGHGSGGARRSPFASPGQGLGSSPWADSLFSSSPELAQQPSARCRAPRRRRRGTRPRCAPGPTPLIASTAATTRAAADGRRLNSVNAPCCPRPPTLGKCSLFAGKSRQPPGHRYKCHLHGQY